MKKKYITGYYKFIDEKKPQVKIPLRCLHWKSGDGECNIKARGSRIRKTGPRHPLVVVKCHHGSAFTIYPPGFGPYRRKLKVPVNSEGEILRVATCENRAEEVGELAWEITFFAASIDASQGISWSRESPANDPRRRRTQGRYMALAATLLGLSLELEENLSQRIADCLGIAYLKLSDLRHAYNNASMYLGRGKAIVSALCIIPVDRTLAERISMAGFIGGLWGVNARYHPG
jgi:hypothetical protein